MNLYLSAPHSNWFMDIYLSGVATAGNSGHIFRDNKPEEAMNIFIAGLHSEDSRANSEGDLRQKIYVLESFYYVKDWMIPYINDHWNFMLDSGAFTFMSDSKKGNDVNWDEYVEDYAKFIVDNDVELFFELDIDSVVGIKEVERLRTKLEKLTNRKSIPVWHRSRGLEYWRKMIREYDYVAIGGIVSKEIRPKEFPIFKMLLREAKEQNTKVHGLGFTRIPELPKYRFHSVDSTAWLYGNRGGFLYHFNGKTIDKIDKPEGTRLKSKEVAVHNLKEWIKFQMYAEINL